MYAFPPIPLLSHPLKDQVGQGNSDFNSIMVAITVLVHDGCADSLPPVRSPAVISGPAVTEQRED